MPAIFALVAEVVANLPQLIQLGMDVGKLISTTKQVIAENGAPGDADWAALDKTVDDLKAQLAVDPPAAA